jgi:hypothetical protein
MLILCRHGWGKRSVEQDYTDTLPRTMAGLMHGGVRGHAWDLIFTRWGLQGREPCSGKRSAGLGLRIPRHRPEDSPASLIASRSSPDSTSGPVYKGWKHSVHATGFSADGLHSNALAFTRPPRMPENRGAHHTIRDRSLERRSEPGPYLLPKGVGHTLSTPSAPATAHHHHMSTHGGN